MTTQAETFTPKTEKLRAYKINGHIYPSVTSVLSYVMPPDLKLWTAKNAALRVAREYRAAIKEGRKITQKELVALGLSEPQRMMKEGQLRGVTVHTYAEDYYNGKPEPTEIPKPLKGYWDAFLKFNEFFNLKPVLQEEVVYSHEFKFAGRMDFYGILTRGDKVTRVLVDFKTANFPHPEWGIQLAAYKHCLEAMGHPVDECYILWLRSHGMYEFIKFDDSFDLFLDVRKLFSWKVERQNPQFELADAPEEYILKMKTPA